MRFFLVASLCLSLAAAAKAADTEPPFIILASGSVLFKVPSGKGVISCVGKFSNTEGSFNGPIHSSVRVKFGAAAEGKCNPCEITLTTAQDPCKPPVVRTASLLVIAPKIVGRTLAHVPGSSDDRTTLGVGEEVMFTVEPKEWFLDSDILWRNGNPWDILTHRVGPATIYQGLVPPSGPGKRLRVVHNPANVSNLSITITQGTDEVAMFPGGEPGPDRPHRQRGRDAGTVSREHSPAALAAAYSAKLDRLEARLAAHGFSNEPVAHAQADDLHRQVPPVYLHAKGFGPALVALASMQSRPPGGAAGEQPEALRIREVRLVAKMVCLFHQALDSSYDLYQNQPDYFAPKLPAGATILPGKMNIEGRYRPEDIREPEMRRQFARAIAENNAKIAYHDKQRQADDADDILRRFAWDYLQEICGRSDPQLVGFKRELIAFGADEKTAEALAQKSQELPVENPSQE